MRQPLVGESAYILDLMLFINALLERILMSIVLNLSQSSTLAVLVAQENI